MNRRIPVGLAVTSMLRLKTASIVFLSAIVCALFFCNAGSLKADTVTLNSGDVLEGKIVSETDTQIEMEVSLYHGSIISKREVLKSDIKSLSRETEEQKQEKAAYANISRYALNPNQEYKPDQYAIGISTFQSFLLKYPGSAHADDVRSQIVAWRSESDNVANGKVKFGNQWMTPEEKQVQTEKWQKENGVRIAQAALQSLKTNLGSLQKQRNNTAENLGVTEGQLAGAQTKLNSLQDTKVPISDTVVTDSGMHPKVTYQYGPEKYVYGGSVGQVQTEQRFTGQYQTIPNPDKPSVLSEIQFYQQQIGQGQAALANLDARIAEIQSQIPRAEHDYQLALVHSQEPPKLVVAKVEQPPAAPPPPPTPTPPPPTPAPPEPVPWYTRLWNRF